MPSDRDTFLPRIESAFYATFHETRGPQILFQVPEGMISQGSSKITESPAPIHRPSITSSVSTLDISSPSSPASYRSLQQRHLPLSSSSTSPPKSSSFQPPSAPMPLLDFSDISRFVIPTQDMCGRLVICSTQKHRVIGFPVCLEAQKYKRVHFRYNLCFVFERTADLSCYEPVVRKIARVLMACEEESSFLSDSKTAIQIHSILEQIYEDLNSYHETSISIDQFNSVELKLFPFYPNPPDVYDWTVPLSLINIQKRVEPNWDLTMAKVCKHIDGINHVSRIANLADCDLELTRQAISHLLYYQCIMTIDIFQYSNIYTMERSLQWLADDPNVKGECGAYVTKPGFDIPDWPHLLFMYSRLKPGRTVFEWEEEHNVRAQGIDVRRFMSFGGFLRRIHRWPILMPEKPPRAREPEGTLETRLITGRKRGKSLSHTTPPKPDRPRSPEVKRERAHSQSHSQTLSNSRSTRKMTEAEEYARSVQLREDTAARGDAVLHRRRGNSFDVTDARRLSAPDMPQLRRQQSGNITPIGTVTPHSFSKTTPTNADSSRRTPQQYRATYRTSPSPDTASYPHPSHLHAMNFSYPLDLATFLDGTHHTDELATRFETGWPVLEKWLIALGAGQGNGDFGRVVIVYR
ncbi:NPR2-domain-containing protein [Ramaria rubella]|nr:NPR2-domain-containing protein [Ramaria rubella]